MNTCGELAAWGNAWLAGQCGLDDVLHALGAVEPGGLPAEHRVIGLGDVLPDAVATDPDIPLGWALGELRHAGVVAFRLVLPAPGDVIGVPGPVEFLTAAIDSGGAVLALGPHPIALLPADLPGAAGDGLHTWTAWRTLPPPPDPVLLADAEYELSVALAETADELHRLDVAQWQPEAADVLADLRRRQRSDPMLPPGLPPRAGRMLALANRLAPVLDLALEGSGASVSGHEVRARSDALRRLATAVRRARVAAYNAGLRDLM